MMDDRKAPPPPKGTGRSGRKLWNAIVGELDLDVHEALILEQMVRCIDRLDAMHAELAASPLTVRNVKGDLVPHPLIVESRQQSILLTRLSASLRLPTGLTESGEVLRPQRRGASRGSYGIRGAV
jgi:hypothetical protein